MSEAHFANDVLREILNILSLISGKTKDTLDFSLGYVKKSEIRQKFPEINFLKQKTISYDTKDLYIYLLWKLYDFLKLTNKINFNSFFPALYLKKVINYMKLLMESNVNIVEDNIIKTFFILLILFFEENLQKQKSNKILDLDESFFKGTFIELKEKYGAKTPYKDSEEIINYFNYVRKVTNNSILDLIEETFQYIVDILRENGKKNDEIIQIMIAEASNILYTKTNLKDEILDDLIKKILEFYSKEENLIFTNYISEVEDIHLEKNIDKEFLKKIKEQYLHFEIHYNYENNNLSNNSHKENLDSYKEQRDKHYIRMKYTFCQEIAKYDLNDETNIFVLSKYLDTRDFLGIQKLKRQLENLDNKKIIDIIKEILNENDFYEKYFSILRCDIIKNFFTSHLITNEENNEFHLQNEKSNDSENFSVTYINFLEKYDKKKDNYNDLKNSIILKILTNGDRAYTLKFFKKIIINPAQFFIGEDIKEDINIKAILKGYLMVILLHETEHFFRALDKSKNIFPGTPREKEGGRMFIKYIFDVQSINHINLEQANKIFSNDIWKSHEELKKIFGGQLEDIEEENIDEFLLNYFKNSISFFSSRKKIKKYANNDFLRK